MRRVVRLLFLSVSFLFVFGASVFAANSGAFRIEMPDAEVGGKGFAFTGEADNPSDVLLNPAGLTQLKGASQLSISAMAIALNTKYKSGTGISADTEDKTAWIPDFYYVNDFGVKDFSFGCGFGSYWGLKTSWADDSFAKYVDTSTAITTKSAMIAAGYKVDDQLSLGLGVDYIMAQIDEDKQLLQVGASDGNLKLKADDNSVGYRLSALYKLDKQNSFGLQYCSQVRLKLDGNLYMSGLNGGFIDIYGDSYLSILGATSYTTKISSSLTLPQSVTGGYSFRPDDKWLVNFDATWMAWSSIKQQSLNYTSETNATRLALLNTGNPVAMNWKNSYTFDLGTEYSLNDKTKLRAGYLYKEKIIPENTWTPSLPDSNVNGITIGAGYAFNKTVKLDGFYGALLYEARKINNNTIGSASGANINGKYNTLVNIGGVTLTFSM
jgi:long-chain fatty acid transport protein